MKRKRGTRTSNSALVCPVCAPVSLKWMRFKESLSLSIHEHHTKRRVCVLCTANRAQKAIKVESMSDDMQHAGFTSAIADTLAARARTKRQRFSLALQVPDIWLTHSYLCDCGQSARFAVLNSLVVRTESNGIPNAWWLCSAKQRKLSFDFVSSGRWVCVCVYLMHVDREAARNASHATCTQLGNMINE